MIPLFLKKIRVDTFLDRKEKKEKRINALRLGLTNHLRCECGTILLHEYRKIGRCYSCGFEERLYNLKIENNKYQAQLFEKALKICDLERKLQQSEKDNLLLSKGIEYYKNRMGTPLISMDLPTEPKEQEDICVICQNTLYEDDQVYTLKCSHGSVFHTHCLFRHSITSSGCPLCRKTIM